MNQGAFLRRVLLSYKINHYLYIIKKIPFLGKLINIGYDFYDFKSSIGSLTYVLLILGNILTSILKIIIPTGIFIAYANSSGMNDETALKVAASIASILLIIGPIASEAENNDITLFTRVFKLAPRTFFLNSTFFARVSDFLVKIIFLNFVFGKLGYLFPLSLAFINQGLIYTVMYLKSKYMTYAEKNNIRIPALFPIFLYTGCFLLAIILSVVAFKFRMTEIYKIVGNIYFLIVGIVLMVIFIYAFIKYLDFEILAIAYIRSKSEGKKLSENAVKNEMGLKDKSVYLNKEGSAVNKLSGTNFLNYTFFSRFKKKFIKNSIFPTLVITGLMLFVVYSDIFKDSKAFKDFISVGSYILMIIIFNNPGNNVISYLFYNCDKALLRFAFYKEKEVVFKNFLQRLKYLTLLNFITVVPGIIIFLFYSLIYKFDLLSNTIVFIIMVLSAEVFISCFQLANYFLFQPYNTEGKIVNFSSMLLRLIPIGILSLNPILKKFGLSLYENISYFTLFNVMTIALIYAVKAKAHKTFKNKI